MPSARELRLQLREAERRVADQAIELRILERRVDGLNDRVRLALTELASLDEEVSGQFRELRARLARLEAALGIAVPPAIAPGTPP